jgi:hypothetical protein
MTETTFMMIVLVLLFIDNFHWRHNANKTMDMHWERMNDHYKWIRENAEQSHKNMMETHDYLQDLYRHTQSRLTAKLLQFEREK